MWNTNKEDFLVFEKFILKKISRWNKLWKISQGCKECMRMMLIFMYDLYCHKTARAQPIKVVLTLSYPRQNYLWILGKAELALEMAFLIVKCKKK